MEQIYKFNSENPLDRQIMNVLNKLVKFIDNDDEAAFDKGGTPPEKKESPKESADPKKQVETKDSKKAPKKRKPKAKEKAALMKLTLDAMIEYLKARGEATLLECRILAKHYNDEFGNVDEVLEVLHGLKVNNFDELTEFNKFVGGVIKLVAAKRAEAETDTDPVATDEDPFGL